MLRRIGVTTRRLGAYIRPILLVVSLAACGGDGAVEPTDLAATQPPITATATATTATADATAPDETESSITTTVAGPATTRPPGEAVGYTFRQVSESSPQAAVKIIYPVLVDLGVGTEAAINTQLDDWARSLAVAFAATAAADDPARPSTLEIELAPELRSRSIFSLSGIEVVFDAAANFSLTRRIGWIFSIATGEAVSATDLFVQGDLSRLAESAAEHLVSDVLGDPERVVAPDGLLPDPANFDAVWLTPDGIGVGFDQFQATAGDVGSPTVLIPFPELADVLDTSGVLATLQDGTLRSEL